MSLLLCLLALFVSSAWAIRSAPIYDLEDAEMHFENFIRTHGKQYADETEKQARFEIFKDHLEIINRYNDGQNVTIYGPTFFSDLTKEEFKRYNGYIRNADVGDSCSSVTDEDLQNGDAPDAFDWREHNAVTPVKNQLKCGSSYAFSSIGNIESQYAIKNGQFLDLSEQQIVDCATTTMGCVGGSMDYVFTYLMYDGGSEGESDYAYTGVVGTCQFDESKVQVKLSGCRYYSGNSQETVKQWLYSNGPISIAMDASALAMYNGGIIKDVDCHRADHKIINHGVLLVGYGTDSASGLPFWIVKNSWGTSWGEAGGYFRMERGEGKTSCGMINDLMSTSVL